MKPEQEAIGIVASLMALAARTAPKGKGVDETEIRIACGTDLKILADEMERIGKEKDIGFFLRDSGNVAASDACVVIGVRGQVIAGVNCGGCGYANCAEMKKAFETDPVNGHFKGPNCVIRMADIGIALGSAAKTAAIHNADNRIMYSAGVAALSLGWCEGCTVAYGIPLKGSGKSIYFDRPSRG
ncbi:MAG: DUF2148 domain-containing protein [Methanoregulaceae archaeon]